MSILPTTNTSFSVQPDLFDPLPSGSAMQPLLALLNISSTTCRLRQGPVQRADAIAIPPDLFLYDIVGVYDSQIHSMISCLFSSYPQVGTFNCCFSSCRSSFRFP